MPSVLPFRLCCSLRAYGAKRSTFVPGANTDAKSNDAGNTPITRTGALLIVKTRPTIASSAANCSRHVFSVSIVVAALLSRHSSALNDRPSRGVTPRKGKKLQVTGTRVRRCVSPPGVLRTASPIL